MVLTLFWVRSCWTQVVDMYCIPGWCCETFARLLICCPMSKCCDNSSLTVRVWGRTLGRNWYKSLKSFSHYYSYSPLLTDITPPPPPMRKSGLKLVCNVIIVYGNPKSENSQDYAQKPQRKCTFTNSPSGHFGSRTLVYQPRVVSSSGCFAKKRFVQGIYHPRDASSNKKLFGDTSVMKTLSWHLHTDGVHTY